MSSTFKKLCFNVCYRKKSQQCLSDMSWRFSINTEADDSDLPPEGRGKETARPRGTGSRVSATQTLVCVCVQVLCAPPGSFLPAVSEMRDNLNRGRSKVSLCPAPP